MKAIETINLTKYYGKHLAIEGVNLTVEQGEVYGFIGPNGAGKSTTIRTLLNFIYPTSGNANIFGLDIINETKKIKRLIGYVPSEVSYYDDLKVRELFEYSAKFYNNNANGRINELANIFEVDMEKNVADLSYGNKKKVSIIQALLHQPKLLILDEPTGGLDPLMQNNFFEVLKEENKKGTTIFFSSHMLNEVQKVCDRVAIIKSGQIIEIEEIDKLRKKNYKKITIELKGITQNSFLNFPGTSEITINGNLVKLLFQGDINILLSYITTLDIENIWIEEPSLEEIFMHYYE